MQQFTSFVSRFLALATLFGEEPIPEHYFILYSASTRAEAWIQIFQDERCGSKHRFEKILQNLSEQSLLSLSTLDDALYFTILAGARDAISVALLSDPGLFKKACTILAHYLSETNKMQYPLAFRKQTLSHLNACLQGSFGNYDQSLRVALSPEQAFCFARKYHLHYRYADAARFYKQAISVARRTEGLPTEKLIWAMEGLACVHLEADHLTEAERMLTDMWHLKSQYYGSVHPATLSTMETLSTYYLMQGRTEEGQEL